MAGQSALTNLELAENSTFVTALCRMECPFCTYVSADTGLTRLSAACPNCGRSGEARILFPEVECIWRLGRVAKSYARANAEVQGRQAQLVERIRSELSTIYERSLLAAAARTAHGLASRSRRSEEGYSKLLDIIRRRLSLSAQEQAKRACGLLLAYSETTDEHGHVVTETANLFDRLLSDFLVRVLASRGVENPKARQRVHQLRSRHRKKRLFEEVTSARLDEAVNGYGVRGLYQKWQQVAKWRNDVQHVTLWAAGARRADSAFNIAKHAFGLFAFLHNKYCVTARAAAKLAESNVIKN